MTTVIENNFIDLQQKATHVLVEQSVIISKQDAQKIIDGFLDEITGTKKTHLKLIPEYHAIIELVASYLSKTHSVEELIMVSESINNLVSTTKRMIKSFENEGFRGCYSSEIKTYKLLIKDLQEILIDIKNRLQSDREMEELLSDF